MSVTRWYCDCEMPKTGGCRHDIDVVPASDYDTLLHAAQEAARALDCVIDVDRTIFYNEIRTVLKRLKALEVWP